MPHSAHCSLNESHSVFNSGRLHQWRKPGSGGGSEELTASWHSTKWAEREWRPLVSLCAPKTPHPTPRHTHTTHTLYCLARSPPLAAECHRIGYRTPCSLHSRVQKPPEELSRGRGYNGAPVTCGPRVLSWAGSHPGGIGHVPLGSRSIRGAGAAVADTTPAGIRRRRREVGGLGPRLRARLLREVASFFGPSARYPSGSHAPDVREWIHNVSVHVEEADGPVRAGVLLRRMARHRSMPNVWLYFPTYHGERQRFNGFCEDKSCQCTGQMAECARRRHPECRGRHLCKPLASGSAIFVEKARAFASMLVSKGRLLGHPVTAVRLTPFYDDCWPHRGRCQGHRPCREPVDQAWTCRATAMLCVGRTWQDALAEAKAWIPAGHPSMSMLYLYDGQTSELLDETFRTWGAQTVGYGADAIIFGPQFGAFHSAATWRATLGGIRSAIRIADACLGRRTIMVFRSPVSGSCYQPAPPPCPDDVYNMCMRMRMHHGLCVRQCSR